MKIGLSRPPTPPHPIPDVDALIVAQHAERAGFESLFYGEHPIRPVEQAGQSVHADGIPFFQDTLVALARISAGTTRLKFGGGIFLIPQHNPVQFAKELASLDFYSGGRLIIGAGIGWSRVECEVMGGQWNRRWKQTREIVQIMKRLWTEETVSHEGEIYSIPPVQLYPQPMTKPWPPVLIGAKPSEQAFARIVDFGDGWLPALVDPEDMAQGARIVAAGRADMDRLAQAAGRDPATLEITCIVRGPQIDGSLGPGLTVDRAYLQSLHDAGADRVLIGLPTITGERDAAEAVERIAAAVL